MEADLLVKDCRVVKPDVVVDVRAGDSRRVDRGRAPPGRDRVGPADHRRGGALRLPGLIDTHLHLGNAAQSFASDCATESRHAVTGGVTTLMPFVITRDSYVDVLGDMQRAVAAGSLVDMALPRHHHPRAADRRDPAHGRASSACASFKTFMAYKGREISPSGIQGMRDDQIFSVFQRVRDIPGGVAIVHCENMELIELHQKPFMAAGRQDTAAWSDARPAFGELEAIRRMCAASRRRSASSS